MALGASRCLAAGAVLLVAAAAVAASTLASHAAVAAEERTLAVNRARELALTVDLGVDAVDSTLLTSVQVVGAGGEQALIRGAAPLLGPSSDVTGVGLVTATPTGLVVTEGTGSLRTGMHLTGPLWARPATSSPLTITGTAVAGKRRLVGTVLRPALGGQDLAAVLVTDPGLARVVTTGHNDVLAGLAASLSAPGGDGHRMVVMTAGNLADRLGGPVSVPLQAEGANLTLTVWPTAPLVGSLQAELQWIVLGVGAALWVLLAVLLRSRAQSAARARDLAVSERRLSATVAELRDATLTDLLTGLPNRAFAHLELADRLARQRPGTPTVAVVALDLDGFTQVNDALGYSRGDLALQAVARRLRQTLRPDDFLARIGSDEYLVLADLPAGQPTEPRRLVTVLLDGLAEEPFSIEDQSVSLRARAGLTLADDSGVVAGELMRRAGTALHAAQAQAGGGWAVFDPSMDSAVSRRFGVGQDLSRAIDTGELQLLYQPLVAIASEQMVGVEALLRWHRPGHGPIAPSLAVDVAESSGLIGKLGTWVLHQACSQAVTWQRAGTPPAFSVGVNVSALQLAEPDMVAAVERALAATGCQPGWLTLEITETCLIGDVEATVQTLQRLRDLGCRLALDDFGTGYSSLDYLTRLPIDILKVDRSILLPRQGDLRRVEGFLAGIRSITTTIGVQALAEGIETDEQLELVRACGFELAQGYLYGRPQAAARISRLLADRHKPLSAAGHRPSEAAGA